PYQFSAADPYIFGYLPYTSGSSAGWASSTGEKHSLFPNLICPPKDPTQNPLINGRPQCTGKDLKAELDKNSPVTLTPGKSYLIRMVFGANANDTGNWVQNCNQAIIKYQYQKPGKSPTPSYTPTPAPTGVPGGIPAGYDSYS
ncbi:hypothetical protein WDW86_21090, partial [Bdellovibrionota bacterium FG-2]